MRINTNAQALNALNNIKKTSNELKTSMEKLSSGKKINRASDDPAALIISERMRAQIVAVEQEISNIENNYNKYATADGNLQTQQNSLQEMRNIALEAANEGGNSEKTQEALQKSMDNTVQSYNNVQNSASFGTQKLFDGSDGSVADLKPMTSIDISSPEKAQEAVEQIDQKMNEVSELRGEIGSKQKNDLEARRNNLETELVNLTAAESAVRDVDMAKEYANFVNKEIQLKASMAILAHQNQVPNLVLDFTGK